MPYKDIESYKAIVDEMVAKDSARDTFFGEVERHIHSIWEKPAAWQKLPWVRAFKTSDNANAIDAAERTLSTKTPAISIMPPLGTNADANKIMRAEFDKIEKAVSWHYQQAERRRDANPTRAIVSSCVRYDEYLGQVIYLPHQQSALKAINGKRGKRSAKFGPFAIKVENPKAGHTIYSDYMLEKLAVRKIVKAHEFVDFWGDLAGDMKSKISSKGGKGTIRVDEDVESNYYVDDEICLVWASASGTGDPFVIIEPGSQHAKHGMGFIPWFHGVGGSDIETEDHYRRKPLINNIVRSGAWHNQMLFGSLMFSLALARAAEETTVTKTATGEGVERDMVDPSGQLKLRPGEEATRLQPADVGPGVKEMFDRLSTWIQASSGTKVLQTLDYPQGSAFATVNALIQAAISVLDPYKQLSEQAIGEVVCLMVAWSKHKKADLRYYNGDKSEENRYGTPEDVPWESLPDQENLYTKIELKPVVPTDEMAKINGATMLSRDLNFPNSRLLDMLGVTDPDQATEEWRQEQKDNTALQTQLQEIQNEFALRMEEQRAIFSVQLNQKIQAMMQQPPGGAQPGVSAANGQPPAALNGQSNMAAAPFQGAQGSGFAGNQGGMNPGAVAPEIMREQITGNPQEVRGLDMGSAGA